EQRVRPGAPVAVGRALIADDDPDLLARRDRSEFDRPVAGAPRKERRQREQDPDPGQSASKRPMADAMANGAMESVGHGSAPVDKAVRPRASPRSCGAGVVVPNLARADVYNIKRRTAAAIHGREM